MPGEETRRLLKLFGIAVTDLEDAVQRGAPKEELARIDAEHMPAYLESTNPANLPRYEALGFNRRDEFAPASGPVITTMWREAR